MAIKMIRDLTQEAEIGKVYHGVVRKIMDFGAFVEIFPGTDGLVHISEIAHARVDRNDITRYMPEGETVPVKVLSVDSSGRIKLSRKAALEDLGQEDPVAPGEPGSAPEGGERPHHHERGDRGDRRGPRGGDRGGHSR